MPMASAEDLPPIGQRKYILEAGNPSAPVDIQNSSQSVKKVYLKDPIQSSTDVVVKKFKRSKRQRVAKAKLTKDNKKVSQIKFKGLKVSGRLTKPRVKFVRDLIEVKRADEPVREDFYNRVFLPSQDSDF
jgi:hypothetical protein